MIDLDLIQYTDRVVGANSPDYDDTLNLALLQVIDESGADPSAFVGFALKPTVAPTVGQFYVATDTDVAAAWTTLTTAMISDLASASTGITKVGTINTGVWQGTSIATTYTDAKVTGVTGTSGRVTIGGTVGAPVVDISASYVGQTSITMLGTVATGVWTATSIGVAYTDAKVVSITGTADRITIGGTQTVPTVDIASTYVGQITITTLGTIGTGVWQGSQIANAYIATGLDVAKLTAGTTIPSNVTTSSLTQVGTIAVGTWQGSSIATTYTDAKIVSVTGTADKITIGGTATAPTFTIAATYAGQTSITTLGTIATGVWQGTAIADTYLNALSVSKLTGTTIPASVVTSSLTSVGTIGTGVWNGTVVAGTYGGTGVNNGASTITIGGNVTFSGAFTTEITVTGNTAVTLPTSGTLVSTSVTSLGSLTSVGGAFAISGAFTGATTGAFSGILSANLGLVVKGTSGVAAVADQALFDFSSGIARWTVYGPDATTRGSLQITSRESDGGNILSLFSYVAGSSTLTVGNSTTALNLSGIVSELVMANAGPIYWRNAAGSGSIQAIYVDAFDGLVIGTGAAITYFPGTVSFAGTLGVAGINASGGVVACANLNASAELTVGSNPPANAAAAGSAGSIQWDSGFIYIAVAGNTWKRVAIATW